MLEGTLELTGMAPKVMWSEGMYIAPHHFQLQSRYFEDAIRFAASSLWFEPYGLTGVELDAESMLNGTVVLSQARGFFPDGMPFNVPETDDVPAPRSIKDLLPPARNAVTLLLGVPLRKNRGRNCVLDNNQGTEFTDTRYVAETRLIFDENTGNDERPIQLGRKALRLLLDTEPLDGLATLALARIVRDGAGHFAYDPDFIPPVLQVRASRRLMLLARRLIEILDEKSFALGRHRADGPEPYTDEIARFWLLHAVNSGSAALRHLVSAKDGHPERLFLELSRLAGALCTFKLDSHPRALPAYNHQDLSGCFDLLDRHIREHLELTMPSNHVSIPLKATDSCFYEGEILDARCLGRARWVLAIRSPLAEADLMARVPRLVKFCSPKFVRELVKRALPGMALQHLPVPPPAVSASVESQYFGISRVGPCWDHIAQTHKIGVYIPSDIPDPEAEVIVILEQATTNQ